MRVAPVLAAAFAALALPLAAGAGGGAGGARGSGRPRGPGRPGGGAAGGPAEPTGGGTPPRRYSCIHGLGHAYMRLYSELLPPALAACRSLGPVDAPDCGQGAFHDYWIALSGLDATRHPAMAVSPRQLCGRQPALFVRACWFRAFLERPPRRPIATAGG